MRSDVAAQSRGGGGAGRPSRRQFLLGALAAPVALVAATATANAWQTPATTAAAPPPNGPFTLPPLPYDYAALEPHIDRETMQIHHDRHHAAYVRNLNEAIAKAPAATALAGRSPEELIRDLKRVPEALRTAVRNNGGGHVNHTMFWQIMKPGGGGSPSGPIAQAINGTFGSFDAFQTAFNDAGLKRFGSGWVWLARTRNGKLEIVTTPNQDNPLMEGGYPILGNDVWEHAYYLKYQNRRADYLKAWWNTVNWDEINNRFAAANQRPGR